MKVRAEQGKELGEVLRRGTEAERREWKGPGLARCGARPGVRLISRCFLLFFSHLLAYSLLLGICNLIVSDLTFDASKQSLLFVGRWSGSWR